jgi:DNA-binding helix-hairpin-helix protein with protein kinase domain
VAAGLGEQYETLRATFETEKARTGGSMRQHQLKAYLDNVLIRDATISNISDGRKATLRAYGIESAWDIDVRDISQIPGFGPALTNNLLVWRSRVESKFVFNPAQAVDPHQLRSLLSRFEPTRRAIVQRLLDCEEALHRLIREHREEADRFREVRLASLECLAQADADVRIMPEV